MWRMKNKTNKKLPTWWDIQCSMVYWLIFWLTVPPKTHTHAHARTHKHTRTHTYDTHTHTHTHTCARTHAHTNTHARTHNTHTHTHTRARARTHTHTHTHKIVIIYFFKQQPQNITNAIVQADSVWCCGGGVGGGGRGGGGWGGGEGASNDNNVAETGGRLEPLQGQSVGADYDVDRCIHWLSSPQLIVTFHFSGHWGGEIACIYTIQTWHGCSRFQTVRGKGGGGEGGHSFPAAPLFYRHLNVHNTILLNKIQWSALFLLPGSSYLEPTPCFCPSFCLCQFF